MYNEQVSDRKLAIGVLRARSSAAPPSTTPPASGIAPTGSALSGAVTEILSQSGDAIPVPTPSVVEAGFVALFEARVGRTTTEREQQALQQVEGTLAALRRGLELAAIGAEPGATSPQNERSAFETAFLWLYDALAAVAGDEPLAMNDEEFELLWESRRSTPLTTSQAIARLLAFAARGQR